MSRQKFMIVNMDVFSPQGLGKQKNITSDNLPPVIKKFLEVNPDPFIILDESSKIKTNLPCSEDKKSTRTRLIKTLNKYGDRLTLTGTMMSKSPVNLIDQYQFLDGRWFSENVFEFAEKYCVMMTIRVGRGRRVLIPETVNKGYGSWKGLRQRMLNAYKLGGNARLRICMANIYKEYAINEENLKWIYTHEKYTPFKNTEELMKRVARCTATVTREQAFDTENEKFINEPIIRYVDITEEQKRLYNQFVKLGFTGTYTLGKGAALELTIRLLDVLNGFNPVTPCLDCEKSSGGFKTSCPFSKECDKPNATFEPLKSSPKLDSLMDLLEEIGDEEQVVVWTARKNIVSAIKERLEKEDISYCEYHGGVSEKIKEQSASDFAEKKVRICIANQQSCAYGVNFMKNCNYEVYVCANNSVEQDYQSRNRLLRAEIKAPKFAYRICFKGTVEERIYRSLALGKDLIESTSEITQDFFEIKEKK